LLPNTFATIVLYGWPFVVLWMLLRYPTKQAIFYAIMGSVLLLPASFEVDLPLLPPLNRETITALSIVIFLFLLGKKFRIFQPGLIIKFIFGYTVVLVISASLNSAPVVNGSRLLPGLTSYDAFTGALKMLLWLMPFFLGRFFFSNLKEMEGIFKALVIIALFYTLPMLLEFRISPQLHRMFYGYHASDFIQQMRGSGYRPAVFVGHGLPLAFWLSSCIIISMALLKNKIRIARPSTKMIVFYLVGILAFTKTWSAIIYVIFGAISIYKLSPVKQIKWAFLIAALVMLYPVTKMMGVFPDQEIIATISEYNVDRADSMNTRFVNEEALLKHALKKPYFGWGGWGRNRIYDEYGKDTVITDGKWIMEIGTNGALGFFFYYAIFLTPLLLAAKNVRYIEDIKEQRYFAALAIILAICIIDSIPNTNMGPMHLLFAGALLGQAELAKKQKYLSENEKAAS
jgi:hypothetical protein